MKLPNAYLYSLHELREAKGYSQREMAVFLRKLTKKTTISQGYYNDIERGRRKPNIDVLHALAVIYNTSMDFVFHCFYRRSVVYNFPDKNLEYGLRKSKETDINYINEALNNPT